MLHHVFVGSALSCAFILSVPGTCATASEQLHARHHFIESYDRSSIGYATAELYQSTTILVGYLRGNYSSNAYRIVSYTESFLGELDQLANEVYDVHGRMYLVNRAYRQLFKHWRRYSAILDGEASYLFSNLTAGLNRLNASMGINVPAYE